MSSLRVRRNFSEFETLVRHARDGYRFVDIIVGGFRSVRLVLCDSREGISAVLDPNFRGGRTVGSGKDFRGG